MGRNRTSLPSGSLKAALFPALPPPLRPPGARLPTSWWTPRVIRCPVTREGGASRGPLHGCQSCGSAGGGAQRAEGGAGRRGAGGAAAGGGDSGSCGATDQAGHRRAHREREVRVAQRSHVSVRSPQAGRGAGAAIPVPPSPAPPRRSQICCPGCGPVPHHPFPGTRAARYRSSPSPGRGGPSLAPQKPPPPALPRPALPPSLPQQGPGGPCPGALEWARPEGGPLAPTWALARLLSRSPFCLPQRES